jgi:DNA-binding beta-propeller fold protein YncE
MDRRTSAEPRPTNLSDYVLRKARAGKLALLCLFVLGLGFATLAGRAADAVDRYRVSQRWPLSGTGGWSFLVVDDAAHRLYVPRDNRLTILNTNNGVPVGEINGLTDVRGLALDPNGELGYVSDGIAGTVHVFNRSTLRLVSSIVVGGIPDAIVFEPITHRLLVFDTHNKSVASIDTSSLRIVGTLSLPGKPAVAISDGAGSVFVSLVSTSQLAKIDARTLTLQSVWQLGACVGPSGIAFDPTSVRVFSVCENKKMVVSDGRGNVVATLPIGEGAKTVVFDGAENLILSANAEGTVTAIKEATPDKFSQVQLLPTEPGARTMAFDPEHRRFYVVSAKFGQRTEPTSEELQFRPAPVPDSAAVLVISR